MNDFSAEFVQTTQDISNQRRTYRGLLYLKSGRRMVYEQWEPERKVIYSDGKRSTDYIPEMKQATVTPLGKADDELFQLFQIPWNPELKKQFDRIEEPREQPITAGHRLVKLIPNRKDVPVILLEVDPATSLIHRFVTTSPDGATNEFRFTKIETKPREQAFFEFKAPQGVDVIENNGNR